jgi:plastocyanin
MYQTHNLNLGPNIKHFVILIPHEGHHGASDDDSRLIDQPFVPSSATISKGTNVIWFNGDVGHEHSLILSDAKNSQNSLENKTTFGYNESFEHQYNSIGDFVYKDSKIYKDKFEMTGKLKVVDSPSGGEDKTENSDIVGSFIAPMEDLDTYTKGFQESGIKTDNIHNYTSPSGEKASLIVWSSSGEDVNVVLEKLEDMTKQLPYE